jgi:alpha-1,3/alpha-1,6-mannosyltransferase
MHAGVPVLASNSGGPLETIVEGETGWLRDAENVAEWTSIMRKVLLDMTTQDFARMAASGKRRAEGQFSLEALEDRLEEEIQDMLTSPRRPFTALQQMLLAFTIFGVVNVAIVAYLLRNM